MAEFSKDAATYAKDGIRINCVCPGYAKNSYLLLRFPRADIPYSSFIKTPMLPSDDTFLTNIAQMIPMKRIAAPEEVPHYLRIFFSFI